MTSKPIITVSGDSNVFSNLQEFLCSELPKEATEWKRSFGRSSKMIHVNVDFVPYVSIDFSNKTCLLKQPILHTYWTDCADMESYKNSLKDNLGNWISRLKKNEMTPDWLIIVVECSETRKGKPSLLRTTVLDKLKSDVGGKYPERCHSLVYPFNKDGRVHESWNSLLRKLRLHFLSSTNNKLSVFEERMRAQREQRNDEIWNFCDYFLLQEQLSFFYEALGFYEESLVQYDELDAIFTQFLYNSSFGASPIWLTSFSTVFSDWSGLSLESNVNERLRALIASKAPSLMDVRNYLFSRQCILLLQLKNSKEMAKRSLHFLHNCVQELILTEVKAPLGSIPSWVFLSCLEILSKITSESNSLYVASLWNYAREKLKELGILCGLLDNSEYSSEQLHRVLSISFGIHGDELPAVEKLKRALNSKEAFHIYYLELCELSISTFKHIGRIRSAKRVGLDLADYYIARHQYHNATPFLLDALNTFISEDWRTLANTIHKSLVTVYSQSKETEKLVGCLSRLSSSYNPNVESRSLYTESLLSILTQKNTKLFYDDYDSGLFEVFSCELSSSSSSSSSFVLGSVITLNLRIMSHLERNVSLSNVSVSFTPLSLEEEKEHIFSSFHSSKASEDALLLGVERTTQVSRLICSNSSRILLRKDSNSATHQMPFKECPKQKYEERFGCFIGSEGQTLTPGLNSLSLSWTLKEFGVYKCEVVRLSFGQGVYWMKLNPWISFSIPLKKDSWSLSGDFPLISGFEESLCLTYSSGSLLKRQTSLVKISSSSEITFSNGTNFMEFSVGPTEPFTEQSFPLTLFTKYSKHQKTSGFLSLLLEDSSTTSFPLSFLSPFTIKHEIGTAEKKKFIRVSVNGSLSSSLHLWNPSLVSSESVTLIPLSHQENEIPIEINAEASADYLWEIISQNLSQVEGTFSFDYKSDKNDDKLHSYSHPLTFQDLHTLIVVQNKIEPLEPGEFLRSSFPCLLRMTISTSTRETFQTSLLYEVSVKEEEWELESSASGILDMSLSSFQTLLLQLRPRVSGQLLMPSVRLSKYFPGAKPGELSSPSSLPHSEPFSPGQIYNRSKFETVIVLLPLGTSKP